ncbi:MULTISPECIES: type I-A CRISPR-associated protein Cas5a [Archaeoglobus]|jgi:CRISPR-associated protein Cas5a/b/c|uniref:Type I-A CRISPR-associated protein Cas5 n=4 Tax=Archaeoglobus fulgidus TaxID=2234 RepID=O28407_ARCFU|nr:MULTISPECIES: type I-A CRISPR-associated protein Cas5a [Archaeoglobus]AAB89384.1 predicted coding region AF_1872 [Archaeoglobus fulgidus DSM 4304]AIG98870.1 CRISPR-associated protein Cas5, subtype I-A/APERN [Archaeoglobus fulgidus DSM 8774]KUJ92899.1 MAG: hypothetical protein XD40_1905 [Archaeoglobus fulgidus]KUK06335.1 MAG: hypothetical protein XD48_1432 [Archaeoglobus fulgidus]MDI3498467.1 CRISPR-associated protein Cas5a/b/c [Archaeoglobus sp.]
MIGYLVDVEFVWGFQARIAGLSKTSPSFYYPPPTTFLGAVAEAIAKDKGIGEQRGKEIISELGENLLAIGWKALNCTPLRYSDINRILAVKITSGVLYPNPQDLAKSFDSPARGKTILSSLNDEAPKIRWFLVFKEEAVEEKILWKIHRIGSKESRVAVVDVKKVKVTQKDGLISTDYSFPAEDGVELRGILSQRWEFEVYLNPFEVKYSEKENPLMSYISGKKAVLYRIPIMTSIFSTPECLVEVGGDFKAYEAGGEVVIGRCSK